MPQSQSLPFPPLTRSFSPWQDLEVGPENLTAIAITTAPRGPRAPSPAPQAARAGNHLALGFALSQRAAQSTEKLSKL